MLIEFRVENHRSIRSEQVFSMEAAAGELPQVRRVTGADKPLVMAAAIYGANASGKTNLLSALTYMSAAVLESHRFWDPEGGVPRDPFGWGSFRAKPSLYEVTFVQDGVRYRYGFTLDDQRIIEEWLHAWPKGRKQTWFERTESTYKIGENLKGENRVVEEITRANALFLSVAAQHRHDQLAPIYRWFRQVELVGLTPYSLAQTGHEERSVSWLSRAFSTRQGMFRGKYKNEDRRQNAEYVRNLLRAADFGILDVKVDHGGDDALHFLHQSDEGGAWLPLPAESAGTRTLLRMAQPVFQTLVDGGVLVVDELERSLHPLLANFLVRQFQGADTNPKHAQLIFTTHDTNLLGTSEGDPVLIREQVWLTEKAQDGGTVVYPLSDYKPRKSENLERGYLQGRYGAIPFIGGLPKLGDD